MTAPKRTALKRTAPKRTALRSSESAAPASAGSVRPDPGSVIVGVDGSRGSQTALEWAQNHVAHLGPVVAVSCWHRPWWDVSTMVLGHDMPEATAALEQRARSDANDAIRRLRPTAATADLAPPSVVTRHGNAGDVLTDFSQDANLLVVGSRGRGRVAGSFLGSTSTYCAHHSSVPVAVVPNGVDVTEPISQIAVGVDGSENSIEALRWTLRFAPTTSVIDVYFSWMTLPIASSLTAPELDRVREASEGFLDAVVDRVIAEEESWDRSIRRHLSVGEPSAVLTASAASMIVVGARSEGGFASIVVGSPANALVHTTEAVTVLVPPLAMQPVQEIHHVG